MFILDKKLQQDSFFIADLELCKVLLMNDANYPWLILVPRQNNLKDIEILDEDKKKKIDIKKLKKLLLRKNEE